MTSRETRCDPLRFHALSHADDVYSGSLLKSSCVHFGIRTPNFFESNILIVMNCSYQAVGWNMFLLHCSPQLSGPNC